MLYISDGHINALSNKYFDISKMRQLNTISQDYLVECDSSNVYVVPICYVNDKPIYCSSLDKMLTKEDICLQTYKKTFTRVFSYQLDMIFVSSSWPNALFSQHLPSTCVVRRVPPCSARLPGLELQVPPSASASEQPVTTEALTNPIPTVNPEGVLVFDSLSTSKVLQLLIAGPVLSSYQLL